jgi:hypothetical protein
VVDDETNDDSHKTEEPTPAKASALPAKRKREASKKKVLKDDSDFEVSEGGGAEEAVNEEGVDDSSEQDDFVERTQNAKKTLKRKKKLPISNKYKGIEFKELTKELLKVACVIHCKQKVKIGETARLQKIQSAATTTNKSAP